MYLNEMECSCSNRQEVTMKWVVVGASEVRPAAIRSFDRAQHASSPASIHVCTHLVHFTSARQVERRWQYARSCIRAWRVPRTNTRLIRTETYSLHIVHCAHALATTPSKHASSTQLLAHKPSFPITSRKPSFAILLQSLPTAIYELLARSHAFRSRRTHAGKAKWVARLDSLP